MCKCVASDDILFIAFKRLIPIWSACSIDIASYASHWTHLPMDEIEWNWQTKQFRIFSPAHSYEKTQQERTGDSVLGGEQINVHAQRKLRKQMNKTF